MSLTKLEIIEETVNFYSEDPSRRATDGRGGCLYYDSDTGKMCGLGRCMLEDFLIENHVNLNQTGSVSEGLLLELEDIHKMTLDDALKPEYRGHDLDFWDGIQTFHDMPDYWNEQGLTEKGKQFINEWTKNLSTDLAPAGPM